jgi:hypothetical protein
VNEIAVIAILDRWIEEWLNYRVIKRFFKVEESDGETHKIYYDGK